jgi:predicted dehydrogenase
MVTEIGVGVIGAGSIADIGHCPSVRAIPGANLIALAEPDAAQLEKMARKWEPSRSYARWEDLCDDPQVDVVIVATPNVYHYEQAKLAMEKGKHVIVEKPFVVTHDEAWDMVRLSKSTGKFCMAGTNQRFWAQNRIARELIDQGFIGQPHMGRSSLHEAWSLYHEQLSATPFRSDPKEAVAGALFDLGSHRVDLLMFLMNSRPKRVTGIVKRLATPESYTTLDDSFFIMIEFESGATGMVSGDRFSPAVSNISEIYGSEGTIFTGSEATNPFQTAPLAVYTDKDMTQAELPEIVREYRYPQLFWSEDIMQPNGFVPKRWVPIYPPRGWAYKSMLEHFIDSVRSEREPSLTPTDSALVVDVLLAAQESMRSGQWVDISVPAEFR